MYNLMAPQVVCTIFNKYRRSIFFQEICIDKKKVLHFIHYLAKPKSNGNNNKCHLLLRKRQHYLPIAGIASFRLNDLI